MTLNNSYATSGRARWGGENVRVHIPTFPVTPGVSDIFRRGDIYSCFGFLSLPLSLHSFLGPCQTVRVLLPVSAGPPTSMTCAFSPPVRVTPSHRIWNEGIVRVANEARVKTESLPVDPFSPFIPASRMRFCVQFLRHDG